MEKPYRIQEIKYIFDFINNNYNNNNHNNNNIYCPQMWTFALGFVRWLKALTIHIKIITKPQTFKPATSRTLSFE